MKNSIKSQSLIEILLALGIFAIMATGIIALVLQTYRSLTVMKDYQIALSLAREGAEAIRAVRDRNFLYLENGTKYLTDLNGYYELSDNPEIINGYYTREVLIEDVYRDGNGDITAVPGTLDPETKKATVTVGWTDNFFQNKNTEIEMYLTSWQGHDFIETNYTEFVDGTFNDTEALLIEPPPDNGQVKLTITETDSGFFSSTDLGKHATGVTVKDTYAYLAVNKTNGGFMIADVSDVNNPFKVSEVDVEGKGRKVYVDGNYAYVTVTDFDKGLAVVNITDPLHPSYVTSLDIDAYGNGLTKKDNYLYVTVDVAQGLKVVDVSDPENPVIVKTVGHFWGNDVEIKGNYAFAVNSDFSFEELQVIDITDPPHATIVQNINLGLFGKAITIKDNYAYISVNNFWSPELVVVDITDPLSPQILSQYYFDSSLEEDVTIYNGYCYIALNDQNAGLAVIDIDDPENPSFIKYHDVQGKGTDAFATEDYVFVTTNTSNKGLVIIGATKEGFTGAGDYVSSIIDSGSDETVYKTISWDYTLPPGGDFKIQIRTAGTVAGLAAAAWVGSNGTGLSYYTVSPSIITVDPDASGTRYFQYKVYLVGDGLSSPALEKIKITYVP